MDGAEALSLLRWRDRFIGGRLLLTFLQSRPGHHATALVALISPVSGQRYSLQILWGLKNSQHYLSQIEVKVTSGHSTSVR